jgi:Tfp pilus assembly protein PilF
MANRNYRIPLILALLTLIAACGPDTIFLRPALDTPQQHVKNGQNLLLRGKLEAARAEFERARTLDERYSPAYVGLALVQGQQGDVAGGFETLEQAKRLAVTPDEAAAVARGFERLEEIRTTDKKPSP